MKLVAPPQLIEGVRARVQVEGAAPAHARARACGGVARPGGARALHEVECSERMADARGAVASALHTLRCL